MTAFPSIARPDYASSGSVSKPAVRSKSQAGYVQTRPRFSIAKDQRTLAWQALSNADFETLRTFFETYQGSEFDWTDPETSVVRSCVFSSDELKWSHAGFGHKSVQLAIEEA